MTPRGRRRDIKDLRLLFTYLRRKRTRYLFYTAVLFFSSLSGLFVPWYMKGAIDSMSPGGARTVFVHSLLMMLLFGLLHAFFRFAGRRGFLVMARELEGEIRDDLFRKVLSSPYHTFDRYATGDIMSRTVNDLGSIWLLAGPGFLTLTGTALIYLLGIFFMLRISVLLTVIVFAIVPLIVLFARVYSRKLYRLHRSAQESLALISDRLNNFIGGIRVIKSYTMERFVGEEFSDMAEDYSGRNIRVSKVSALFHGVVGAAAGLGVFMVLLVGGALVVKGRISIGGFVAFTSYIGMLSFPTIAMGWVINLFQRGASAAGRIGELMEGEEEPGGSAVDDGVREIEFRDVHFSYPGGKEQVLRGLDLRAGRGTVLGITGLVGSGKSSLIKLLLKFYEPGRGEILINGRPLASYDPSWVRRKIGVVFQDSFLFSDTILENISFPLKVPDLAISAASASAACVDREIESFPGGYDAVIGERGVTLSGGQKQRVSLARTLTHEHDVLILDDSFSSVDVKTEKGILENLMAMRGDKTVVIISHRLSVLSLCDRIAVIDAGRVVEEGTEAELLKEGGLFYRFFARQSLFGSGGGRGP